MRVTFFNFIYTLGYLEKKYLGQAADARLTGQEMSKDENNIVMSHNNHRKLMFELFWQQKSIIWLKKVRNYLCFQLWFNPF